MDAGKVQGRWAEHYRCAVGRDPGALLQKELVDAWRDSDVARRRAAGEVVDGDGVPIAWVWKTWAWETALDQLRAEFEGEDRVVLPAITGNGTGRGSSTCCCVRGSWCTSRCGR